MHGLCFVTFQVKFFGSQHCFCNSSKGFQNLFAQAYLFGPEMAGKLWITALHVENFTMIVMFGL